MLTLGTPFPSGTVEVSLVNESLFRVPVYLGHEDTKTRRKLRHGDTEHTENCITIVEHLSAHRRTCIAFPLPSRVVNQKSVGFLRDLRVFVTQFPSWLRDFVTNKNPEPQKEAVHKE
jgi:hypothetical protein